jgi:hypothetical protein
MFSMQSLMRLYKEEQLLLQESLELGSQSEEYRLVWEGRQPGSELWEVASQ